MSKQVYIQKGGVIGRVATYTDRSDIKKHGLKGRRVIVAVRAVVVDEEAGGFNALVEPCDGGRMIFTPIVNLDFHPHE